MHVFCVYFSYQRDDEDGDDMDSYQVLLPSTLWHGAQLLLTASLREQRAGRRKEERRARIQFFTCVLFASSIIRDTILSL